MYFPSWPSKAEISERIATLRINMADESLDALVILSRHNLEYYTGFRSTFWTSNARPFIAMVRLDRPGITLLVSKIEGRTAGSLGNADVHPTFYPGFDKEAWAAATDFLDGLPARSSVGFDYGNDMSGRGSLVFIDALRAEPRRYQLHESADLIWRQRYIKSDHEAQSIRTACTIANTAFYDGLADLRLGMTEYEYGQILKQRMIGLGAQDVEWLPVRFGHGGWSYTTENSDTRLQQGDFVWVDMGARIADGVSDFNRVVKIGKVTEQEQDLYSFVRDVTLRLAEGVRPGMTGDEVFKLFAQLWSARKDLEILLLGRIGHGSGVALTEPPSLVTGSDEVIQENMVLHVEPKLEFGGGIYQNEEVFRVKSEGPEFLTTIAPPEFPSVDL